MNDYERRRIDGRAGEKGIRDNLLNTSTRAVQYYLLSISTWNMSKYEDHYYLRKKDINKTEMARKLNLGRTTIYRSFTALKTRGLLREDDTYYILPMPEAYSIMRREVLEYLIGYFKIFGSDIIRICAILKYIPESRRKQGFNASELVYMLEHVPTMETRVDVCSMLAVLERDGFIKYHKQWVTNNTGLQYYKYYIDEVKIENLPQTVDKDEPIDLEDIEELRKGFIEAESNIK